MPIGDASKNVRSRSSSAAAIGSIRRVVIVPSDRSARFAIDVAPVCVP
jgi:hypothetical protein